MSRKILQLIGGGLAALGAVVLLLPLVFFGYSHYMSEKLYSEAKQSLAVQSGSAKADVAAPSADETPSRGSSYAAALQAGTALSPLSVSSPGMLPESKAAVHRSGLYPESAPAEENTLHAGELIGTLSIPGLHIQAAIIEGTDQQELAKTPGHLPDSVLPGQVGTSVIAAHNATTFRHIDQLKAGMRFTITTKQGKFTYSVTDRKILHVKDSLPNMAYPAVALETCYPLDALYLTDRRLFVEAALVKSELNNKK